MIIIQDKNNCCGCASCVQRCPHHCITMVMDDEGFSYPKVEVDKCTKCNLCNKVCPVINQGKPSTPSKIFAAKNKNRNILKNSSSGGIFTSIAEYIISKGGVVFGACYDDNWDVVIKHTEVLEGIAAFRGSKYVQADMARSYIDAEIFLKNNRLVLFTGTPCQIAGLKKFLRKDYNNLYTASIICHGVPSPGIWNDYKIIIEKRLNSLEFSTLFHTKSKSKITEINFRDKKNGWRNYGFSAKGELIRNGANNYHSKSIFGYYEYHQDNEYLRGYMHNLYLRPSCYHCPAREGRSEADIQLGDYWGVERRTPEMYDPLGVSLVLIYSEKGFNLLNALDVDICSVRYDDVLDCNINVVKDEIEPELREEFFKRYKKEGLRVIKKICNIIDNHNATWYLKKIIIKIKKYTQK